MHRGPDEPACTFAGERAARSTRKKLVRQRGFRMRKLAFLGACVACLVAVSAASAAGTAIVTVGSPPNMTPQNHQNEPAVALNAADPNILVAGVNDFVDWQPCPKESAENQGTCFGPADDNVGLSGVYFSFDRGNSWTQPTYTGWTAADCAPTISCQAHPG